MTNPNKIIGDDLSKYFFENLTSCVLGKMRPNMSYVKDAAAITMAK